RSEWSCPGGSPSIPGFPRRESQTRSGPARFRGTRPGTPRCSSSPDGRPPIKRCAEGLALEGRRHRVSLGLLDERGGIRSQRFPFRGIVIRGVLLGETAGAVEGQDPDERVPPWDDPRPLDAEAEFPPERQDTASPSGEPFVHLSLLDPIDSELGLGGHPFRPSIRNMVANTDASGWPRRTRARACPAVEAEEVAGRE